MMGERYGVAQRAQGIMGCGVLLALLWMAMWSVGCGPAVNDTSRCDVARRCASDNTPVCGADGRTYTCAAMAACEQVAIDASKQACQNVPPDPQCEPVTCELFCADGFARDANNCEVCACADPSPGPCFELSRPECAPGEEVVCEGKDANNCPLCFCEPVVCDLFCENGFASGPDGCRCAEPVECEPVTCELFCAQGYQIDDRGCEICACNSLVCPDVVCPAIECEYGTVRDDTGCSTCECAEPPVCEGGVVCALACEYGFKRGDDGCEVCDCAEPTECPELECPDPIWFWCDEFQRDANGCQTCDCADPVMCENLTCDLFCEYGFATGADGCGECRCQQQPPECEANDGGVCPLFCADGFLEDAQGCTLCQCAPGARCDIALLCAPGELCQPEDSDITGCCPPGALCAPDIRQCRAYCVQ